jgi:DNA polymerase I-like protein with 3'-5' exonuclease and polymerase domains
MAANNAAFLGTREDEPYFPHLKVMFRGVPTYVSTQEFSTLVALEMYCSKREITRVATTRTDLLGLLVRAAGAEHSPSLSDYAGSLFTHKGIDIVFVDPLAQLVSVPYGKFITDRFISKIVAQEKWAEPSAFSFTVLDTPARQSEAVTDLTNADLICIDIETLKHNLSIKCIGYTGVFFGNGSFTTRTYVLPLGDTYALATARTLNSLPAEKIFQNGKYDNAYLLRYCAMPRNWLWDTAHFMHSWYAELPKDLGFLNAFFLRKVVYWKDLAETSDLYEYYKYCGLDTWATANVFIQQILTAPDWARHNYFLEFPLVYPCLLAEMTGLAVDPARLEAARANCDAEESSASASLEKMLGTTINPASHVQVKKLLKVLTGKDWESSDEKSLKKASLAHPVNERILTKVTKIREVKKRKSTYLRTDADIKRNKDGTPAANSKGSKHYKGFWLYSINPHGTDTGRNASGEHQYWCGANVQNVETGPAVKQIVRAFSGFRFAEVDLEQAESRDTAHIAGSEPLIAAVSGTRDFHSVNASAFFGTPYTEIYDDTARKTKNKKLRDLAKRVNHGANYNMGAGVLIDTMGEDKIWEAARLLGLRGMNPKQIAEYLLERFHTTYPELKRDYYASVIREVLTTRRIVSRAIHWINGNLTEAQIKSGIENGDWTRYCFGQPDKNKLHLNSYVAHCPQSLNARTLNEAFMKVFYEIALPHAGEFCLHAQIHDSILCSFKEGRHDLVQRVKELMEIPVSVRGVDGKTRTFTVPAAIKAGSDGCGSLYWSDTE